MPDGGKNEVSGESQLEDSRTVVCDKPCILSGQLLLSRGHGRRHKQESGWRGFTILLASRRQTPSPSHCLAFVSLAKALLLHLVDRNTICRLDVVVENDPRPFAVEFPEV